jgi:uncharacterized membrane protein YkvA (DUF1232 family)
MQKNTFRKLLPHMVIIFGILYGIWPIDLIPDVPIVGWIDDIGVLGAALLFALRLMAKNREFEGKRSD